MANCLPHFIVDGKRETLGYLRKSGDRKGCCGIYFTSTPLFGSPVLPLLEEFYLIFCFVIQMFEIVGEWISVKDCSLIPVVCGWWRLLEEQAPFWLF